MTFIDNTLWLSIVVIILLLFFLFHEKFKFKQLNKKYEMLMNEYSLLKERFSVEVTAKSRELFERWKEEELESYRRQIAEALERECKAKLKEWMREEEKRIRQDAIERSTSTIMGKVGEQLAPLMLFLKYDINPKDVRFIGSPVDFIAFKGLSEGNLEEIVFIEVKSGKTSDLTHRERMIRKVVEDKRISWLLLNLQKEIQSEG